jgi:predicted methyltransferase
MLARIRESLKPGGRLAIIERRKEDLDLPFNALHRMSVADTKAEVEPEGFARDKVSEILPTQHIMIFKLK